MEALNTSTTSSDSSQETPSSSVETPSAPNTASLTSFDEG
jgi:hypothetical protein